MCAAFMERRRGSETLGSVMDTGLCAERGKHWYQCHCGWVSRICETSADAEEAYLLHVRQTAARDALDG